MSASIAPEVGAKNRPDSPKGRINNRSFSSTNRPTERAPEVGQVKRRKTPPARKT